MAKLVVENPDLHQQKTVDKQGRIYLGQEFVEKEVEVIVEIVDESEEE